ncbi:MAG: MotA/TolQ/ExbB proton channel family protein [Phycisphaeraceae bacterium]
MYFRFDCPHCSHSLKVREEHSGRKVRCPHCHNQSVIPAPPAEAAGADTDASHGSNISIDPSTIPVARTRRREVASSTPRGSTEGLSATSGTNVSMLLTAGVALVATAVFLLAMLPLKGYYFSDLFLARGWVPFAETYLLFWSVAILVFKTRKIRRQRETMLFDLLPSDRGEEINENNVDEMIRHVHAMPTSPSQSFLVNRVQRGLEHYRVRRSSSEVANMMSSQSDIDSNGVESSYTLIKVFIWAIPILGFIGTVLGISDAVGSFDASINTKGVTTDQLTSSLSGITGGLAMAFDTTLVALVMSLIIMFPASSLQKSEEDLLNWVDEYCNENLLKRLADSGPRAKPLGEVSEHIRAAMNDALAGNYGAMLRDIDEISRRMADLQTKQIDRFDRAVTEMSERAEDAQHEIAAAMLQATQATQKYFEQLDRGLGSLSEVLRELGGKQIVVQTQQQPKRGWWPFGRKNQGNGE